MPQHPQLLRDHSNQPWTQNLIGSAAFANENNFSRTNDAERGLKQGKRIESVKTLTIADGLRTPVGEIPW